MLKFLRKAAALVTPAPTVQEIHDSFDTATQKAVEQAKNIIAKANYANLEKRVSILRSLGFNNMPEVLEHDEGKSERAKAAATITTSEKWSQAYPQYKFITLENVVALCKKYGLFCAPVGRYKGSIPEKNLQEIASFKVKDEDIYYEEKGWVDRFEFDFNNSYRFRSQAFVAEAMALYEKEMFRVRAPMDAHDRYMFDQRNPTRPTFTPVPKFICAPKGDFVIKDNEKVHGEVFITQEIKDPIVLHYVKDGFLIVSKWGPEAEDPAVINEKMN